METSRSSSVGEGACAHQRQRLREWDSKCHHHHPLRLVDLPSLTERALEVRSDLTIDAGRGTCQQHLGGQLGHGQTLGDLFPVQSAWQPRVDAQHAESRCAHLKREREDRPDPRGVRGLGVGRPAAVETTPQLWRQHGSAAAERITRGTLSEAELHLDQTTTGGVGRGDDSFRTLGGPHRDSHSEEAQSRSQAQAQAMQLVSDAWSGQGGLLVHEGHGPRPGVSGVGRVLVGGDGAPCLVAGSRRETRVGPRVMPAPPRWTRLVHAPCRLGAPIRLIRWSDHAHPLLNGG